MILEIEQLLKDVVKKFEITDEMLHVTASEDPTHGDYATNIAFIVARMQGKSPREVASEIVVEVQQSLPTWLEKVEVAGAGFINFTLSSTQLIEQLSATEKKKPTSTFTGQKIMLEFTDPNPFKEFHIGHLYSNIVGESLARLLESQGAEVRRVNYQGDVGLHVAKALYGLQKNMTENRLSLSDLGAKSLDERAKFLGSSYALGATAFEEDEEAKSEMIEINKRVYEVSSVIASAPQGTTSSEGRSSGQALSKVRPHEMDSPLREGAEEKDSSAVPQNDIDILYQKGRTWSLAYFETIYMRLGTKFEEYYFESEAGPTGIALVQEYLGKGIFEESQGAVIFPGEKYGLHNRVFINSLGLPTYEAKELGLAVTKYSDYKFDQSIMVTGNEINEYFRVLLKALSLIRPEIAEKTTHLSHGMVRLPEGKMSSRTGNVLTGEWLLNTAVTKAREKMEVGEMRVENMDEVAEQVGVGAIKYALLKNGIGRDIAFSFTESISFEGNAGPYLQYTYARTQSVIRKWHHKGTSFAEVSQMANGKWQNENDKPSAISYKPTEEERQLLAQLIRFDDVVAEAAVRFSPNMMASYLFELAQGFNLFYQKHQIIKEEEGVRAFRLKLTEKVGETLKNGLYLLGIQAPEKM